MIDCYKDRIAAIEAQLAILQCIEVPALGAFAFVNGDGTLANGCNIESTTRLGTGIYRVRFIVPMSTASYPATKGNINNFATRDGRHIEIIDGTQSAIGYDYYVATGDNGATADVLIDGQASWFIGDKRIMSVCNKVN